MSDSVLRELRLLKGYAIVTTLLFGSLSVAAFRQSARKTRFTEIDVERINIVEPNGALRMVISNRPRSIGPIYKGKPFGYAGGTRPGIIFFNDEGTENGGLTFTGRKLKDGTYASSTGMSFDQFNSDETLTLRYTDDNGRKSSAITIADRDVRDIYDLVMERDSINKMTDSTARTEALERLFGPRNGVPLAATRVYLGRDRSKAAVLNLFDPNGKPRLRLKVDSLGTASLEFLDAAGAVTARFPEPKP
ncbi:MAG TPA: hypothetical protein VGP87_04400 [Gemmatimonadales bacterium]|jgi:hypothetical protein|nr:hypothetical protein [Gemmatimonadales bacterium]